MLSAFHIAQYPVPVAEYARFLRATGRTVLTGEDGKDWQVSWRTQLHERLDHPVVMVNRGCCHGVRELACRAGLTVVALAE
jgi:formylglycine-generating enzyme required for sulfatase activity